MQAATARYPKPVLAAVTSAIQQLAQVKKEKGEKDFLSMDSKIAKMPTWLGTLGATPGVCINELNPLQVLKTRIFSQVCIAQILDLQGQGDEFLDEAFALVEAATKPVVAVAVPGAINQPLTTGSPNVAHVVTKSTRVVRAAYMATKSNHGNRGRCGRLPGQAQVRIARCLRAGQKARVQLQQHADVLMFPVRDIFCGD